jgi:hypothetical protein
MLNVIKIFSLCLVVALITITFLMVGTRNYVNGNKSLTDYKWELSNNALLNLIRA